MDASRLARSHRTLLAWALACALLVAQVLGLLHGVVHLPSPPPAGDAVSAPAHGAAHATARADGLAALFTGHAEGGACRLYDAIGHDGLAAPAAPVLPALALPAFLATLAPATCPAPGALAFDARGPPSQH